MLILNSAQRLAASKVWADLEAVEVAMEYRYRAQRLAASKVWAELKGYLAGIETTVLNALRHLRFGQLFSHNPS